MIPASQPTTGPSPTEHSRFPQDGYLVLPNALPASIVADLQTACDRLLIHTIDTVVREQHPDERLT